MSRGDQSENVLAVTEARGEKTMHKEKRSAEFPETGEDLLQEAGAVSGLGNSLETQDPMCRMPGAGSREARALSTPFISKQQLPTCKVELG